MGCLVFINPAIKRISSLNIGSQVLENKKIQQAFIYFNNTWGTGALRNARQLLTLLQKPAKQKFILITKNHVTFARFPHDYFAYFN